MSVTAAGSWACPSLLVTPHKEQLPFPRRTEHFAAEARSADHMVMKLKHETAELKTALEGSKSDCHHLRQQLRVGLPSGTPGSRNALARNRLKVATKQGITDIRPPPLSSMMSRLQHGR